MYNLLEYSDNYSDSSGSLYQFKRDEPPPNNAASVTTTNSSSFKYKANILGNMTINNNTGTLKNVRITVPLKYLGNFFILGNLGNH